MRVLIVEDDPGIRLFLCRAVEYLIPHARVISQANGRLGRDSFWADPADLVISDHRMPQMTGIDLLYTLRTCSMVPFILISAESEVKDLALAAGASIFLPKPISLTDLRMAIGSVIPIRYTESCNLSNPRER